jgi:hypothetical protein
MKIHFFRYAHGEEKTISHDVVQNAFVFIVKDEECVLCEQTHVIPLPTFHFSHQKVDIVVLMDDV